MKYYYYTLQKRHHDDLAGIKRNPYADDDELYPLPSTTPLPPENTGRPSPTLTHPGTTARPDTYPYPKDERAPRHVARMGAQDYLGRKDDAGKLDYTLLPWDALTEVVKVLQHGCEKYQRDNWMHVPNAAARYEAAGMRHRIARLQGEDKDPESGLSHLAHETTCLLFQLWFKAQEGK